MFTVLHANHLEDLRDLALEFASRHPLGPLANETFLVQSNGMAQWLKLCVAQQQGVAASLDFPLPSSFVWRAYRAVLGQDIPTRSPFDKGPMTWRLMRLLPRLVHLPEFEPLRHYLKDELKYEAALDRDMPGHDEPDRGALGGASAAAPCGARKSYQLAARLADLFDQYLVYRPDWMAAWGRGETAPADLAAVDRWQPLLWRYLLEDADDDERRYHRAALHDRFLIAARALDALPRELPPRLFVFGISALPFQLLEALHALSGVMDVVLMVANPCRYYWGDIVADREVLRARLRRDSHRQRHRVAPSLEGIDSEALHLRANPLLAGWGAQGRDFIEALYEFEADNAFDLEHDVFRDPIEAGATLLHQLQQEVLDLIHPANRAEQEGGRRVIAPEDRSLAMTRAHSPLREVEILFDQMLDAFERDATLRPRDMVVLVPDIESYAPLIDAVFGQVGFNDSRYIPYTISDRVASGASPLMSAVLALLELPERRLGVSEIMRWLEVPAFRRRFGIEEASLDRLARWLEGSGVRWGLDAEHRRRLDLPGLADNTWQFGLERMLLGFAIGEGSFDGISAFDEVGGLEAELVGRLALLIDALRQWCDILDVPATPRTWASRLDAMLEALLAPAEQADYDLLERVSRAAGTLSEEGECARFEHKLPLAVFREALTDRLDAGGLAQRFLAGRVNFATLMPMRAIPFRCTWLLGMNDGAYPRVQLPQDFDLMATRHRSGDRSRRDDDRFLLLEALLASRDRLTLSWVGRDQRDNSECPPSILISELLDTLGMGWQGAPDDDSEAALHRRLITTHPLQPFARAYFGAYGSASEAAPGLYTYEQSWEALHQPAKAPVPTPLPPAPAAARTLALDDLERLLRRPFGICTAGRLGIHFSAVEVPSEDSEPFGLDGLAHFELKQRLLSRARRGHCLATLAEEERRRGTLPALGFGEALMASLLPPLEAQLERFEAISETLGPVEPLEVALAPPGAPALDDRVDALGRDERGALHRCLLAPSHFGHLRRDRSGCLVHYGKPHRLVRPWLEHLALAAAGEAVTSTLVFEDRTLAFPPVPAIRARGILEGLLESFRQALDAPLPAMPNLAFEYFAAWPRGEEGSDAFIETARERARRHYEESAFNGPAALVEREPMMGELWPRFEDLAAAGFERWTQALYGDLVSDCRALADA